jgi:hypothetical protein
MNKVLGTQQLDMRKQLAEPEFVLQLLDQVQQI